MSKCLVIANQHCYSFLASNPTGEFDKRKFELLKEVIAEHRFADEQQRDEFFSNFIKAAISNYNAMIICWLANTYPNEFGQWQQQINNNNDEYNEYVIASMLKNSNPELLTERMQAFTNGFGNLEHESALLTCAQTKNRKDYYFNPHVVEDNLVGAYFTQLRSLAPPVTERFVITGTHWVSGEIRIDNNGQVNILIIDSVAYDGSFLPQTEDMIADIKEAIPESNLYVSKMLRQNSAKGCSAFALDDVRHLYANMDQYLPEQYRGDNGGLFSYLADHSKFQDIDYVDGGVHLCDLPLRFMRTMQSRKARDEVFQGRPDAERFTPVSKKEDYLSSVRQRFRRDLSGREVNRRIEYKLNGMAHNLFDYLVHNDERTIQKDRKQFNFNPEERLVLQGELEPQAPRDDYLDKVPRDKVPFLAKYDQMEAEYSHQAALIEMEKRLQEDLLEQQAAQQWQSNISQAINVLDNYAKQLQATTKQSFSTRRKINTINKAMMRLERGEGLANIINELQQGNIVSNKFWSRNSHGARVLKDLQGIEQQLKSLDTTHAVATRPRR